MAFPRRSALARTALVASAAMPSLYDLREVSVRSNIIFPCLSLWSSPERRMSDRLTAPPGTSIDWSALTKASLRRLTSSSLGAPTTGAKVAWASTKSFFASSGVVMVLTTRAARRERSGEHGDRAVVSAAEEVCR